MSIKKRTVYYDNTGGVVRFWDWAIVQTTQGVGAEPFMPNERHTHDVADIEFDPTDEIARIDELVNRDVDQSLLVLSGGEHQLHGGYMIPRTGK